MLEAGCGVGAQTVPLARNSPGAQIVAIDRSTGSLAQAELRLAEAGIGNVELRAADMLRLPFQDASFDHVFVCFVLEHMPDPETALAELQRGNRAAR